MRWDILFAPDARMPDGTPFQWRGQAMGGDDHVVTQLRQALTHPARMGAAA